MKCLGFKEVGTLIKVNELLLTASEVKQYTEALLLLA